MVWLMVVLPETTTITPFTALERLRRKKKQGSRRILHAQKEEKTIGWLPDRSGWLTSSPLEVADF
jgi:hypothetical protein